MNNQERHMQKERNSSIELLKIISIIIIVFCHSIPDGNVNAFNSAIQLGKATDNLQYLICEFIRNLGQIGNNIFIVCSAWFLIESTKVNTTKIAHIIGDCVFISNLFLIIFMAVGYKFPTMYIVQQIRPVTYGGSWFVTCYLLLYVVHPLLNKLIKSLDKKTLMLVNLIFITLYCIISFLNAGLYFYSNIIGFIGIYFIVAYYKLYLLNASSKNKFNIVILATGIVGWFAMNLITNFLGLHIGYFTYFMQRYNVLVNPCFILIALGAFGIAKNKCFYIKHINYISSLSLLIYVIHCNRIIRDYVRFDVFQFILEKYTYSHLLLWVVLYALISLIVGVVLAILYNKTIQKIVHKVFELLEGIAIKIYRKVENILIKFD